MDIVQRVNGLSHLGAAWVLWLLVALSVVGVAIVIERAVVLWLGRDDVRRIRSELTLALSARDVERARHRLQESPSVEAKVASVALECEDPGAARERIASASALARLDLSKNLGFLGTLGNNAPFVGLFGTVIGIIRAFQALEHSAGQVSAGLMSEIGEALVATAVEAASVSSPPSLSSSPPSSASSTSSVSMTLMPISESIDITSSICSEETCSGGRAELSWS